MSPNSIPLIGISILFFIMCLISFGYRRKRKEHILSKTQRSRQDSFDIKQQIKIEISLGLSNEQLILVDCIKNKILSKEFISFKEYDRFLICVAVANIIDEKKDFYFLLELFYEMEKSYNENDEGRDFFQRLAQDCRIMTSNYDDYLLIHEKDKSIRTSTHYANSAINVYLQSKKEPKTIDLVRLTGARKSKFITANNETYLNMLDLVFTEYASERGGWYQVMKKFGLLAQTYDFNLFNGIPSKNLIKAKFPLYCLYTNAEFNDICKLLQREAESRARKSMGLKGVGEGWLSETLLYNELVKKFPNTEIVQHGRPDWLGRQHLDIWFKDWNIGIEYHGEQHFQPVDFFGGKETFEKTKRRDELKKRKCKQNNLHLIIVTKGYDLDLLVNEINSHKPTILD